MLRKILKILKTTTQIILVTALGFAISLGVLVSVQESSRFPTAEEFGHLDNVSKHLEQKEYHPVGRKFQQPF